ncbi:MAG: zf-HC2 domain-containing protein [Candidatus Sumerlaeia bacterium]|nr:zf-HC2 domain-containing protein [Candidatus Sumerlaeia bacterium]
MDCQNYRQWIHDLLDGDLDGVRRADLEQHLDDCDACARNYREAVAVDAWARAFPAASAPPDFVDRVFARIAAEPAAPRMSPARAACTIAAVAGAALMAGWVLGGKLPYEAVVQIAVWVLETARMMAVELWTAGREAAMSAAGWWTAVVARPPAAGSQFGLILAALAASVAMAVFNIIQKRKAVKG